MVAADVTRVIPTALPSVEVVVLTVSDGETYESRKFGEITAAIATGNADVDADLNVTYSGSEATINWAGQTDQLLTLQLWGN